MINHWAPAQEIEIPSEVQEAIGGHPLVAQTLARRGLLNLESIHGFLDPDAYQPCSPNELPGMDKVVERLFKAIRHKETIGVWGDFDVDGQTSTTLLVSALMKLGGKVIFHIPVRKEESHGVNLPNLKRMLGSGAELFITCDTGISASEEIAYAQRQGVDVLVTDHHDLPEVLPPAYAIVNPKMLPLNHPLATLPGVGVAYEVVNALFHKIGDGENLESNLDLVALGIVADLALLTGDTRYLLQKGIQTLRQNQRLGLQVMQELAGIEPDLLSEEHIAFELAPRLNALGRLSNPKDIVEFFTTTDQGKARIMAIQLEGLNEKRKLDTKQVFQAALSQIKSNPELLTPSALVLSHPTWPGGIIGIVASRLVEKYQKPTLLIATPYGEIGRGSARSIPGINITAAIAAHKEMLGSFGGHPMAAGFSIPAVEDMETAINRFRKAISKTIDEMAGNKPVAQRTFDGYLPLENLTDDLVEDFERLAPFGAGNPALNLVSRNMEIIDQSPLGKTQEHLLVTVKDDFQNTYRIVWWQGVGWEIPEGKFDLVYRARATKSSGKKGIQIEWIDAKPPERPSPELISKKGIELVDCRGEINPTGKLRQLQGQTGIQVWSEGVESPLQSVDRLALNPGDELVIWTSPPGWEVIHFALARVSPSKIYLFALDPGLDQFPEFIQRLIAFIKYAITHYQGLVDPAQLAAKTSHQEITIRAGFDWLAAAGYFIINLQGETYLIFTPGNQKPKNNLLEARQRLDFLLKETAAFRKIAQTKDCELLRKDFFA